MSINLEKCNFNTLLYMFDKTDAKCFIVCRLRFLYCNFEINCEIKQNRNRDLMKSLYVSSYTKIFYVEHVMFEMNSTRISSSRFHLNSSVGSNPPAIRYPVYHCKRIINGFKIMWKFYQILDHLDLN